MVNIAVLGYGTVGSGVVEVINTNHESINKRAGQEINIKYVLDLRDFPGDPVQEVLVHDYEIIANDPEVDIVVEVMGGIEPAYTFVKRALESGKSVCTSNKALVAKHGPELMEIAKEKNINFLFEASCGGGIPIIRALNGSLTADEVDEITGILKGLGFSEEDFTKEINTLSGGQRTRVALGKLLLKNPDILLLDEPTNHLDVDSIKWLENYLSHYKGAVIIVSHDRYFLDKIVNKVMEIDQGHSMLFDGNYTTFIEKRDQIKAIRLKEYKHQQQEIKHQQEVIKKLKQFNREKSIKRAESREKALNKIDVLEKPTEYNADMRLSIEPEIISGNDVLTLKDVSKSFGNKSLFHGLSADIFREERVALIGPNGTGKTTLLKIICKKISNNGGTISLGAGVSIGYYDQAQDNLDDSKTIFDEISDAYPDLNNTKIRNTLAAFLFYGEDVFRPISSLSGGEKGRVSLAKLMLSHANFLILDEPTNHLDIQSKEILESAMNAYTGTILYVSHDRYFINKTATRILEISDHGLTSYPGDYQDYIAQKEKEKASLTSSTASSVSVDTESKLDWKQQKEEQAKQRKKENRLKKVEEQITELETKQEELSEAMSLPENASDPAKLMELSNEQASIASSLEELYEEWETLC